MLFYEEASRFSGNSEADAWEYLESIEEMFPRYYMQHAYWCNRHRVTQYCVTRFKWVKYIEASASGSQSRASSVKGERTCFLVWGSILFRTVSNDHKQSSTIFTHHKIKFRFNLTNGKFVLRENVGHKYISMYKCSGG